MKRSLAYCCPPFNPIPRLYSPISKAPYLEILLHWIQPHSNRSAHSPRALWFMERCLHATASFCILQRCTSQRKTCCFDHLQYL